MPTRPRTPCVTPRCSGFAVRRGRCERCLRVYEQQRPSAAERGYDKDWERLRAEHLTRHPWCATGTCRKRATDVDHRVSIKVAPHRRLDPTNLVSYCHECHSRKTVREDGGFGRPGVG